jgi:hypothetical protein
MKNWCHCTVLPRAAMGVVLASATAACAGAWAPAPASCGLRHAPTALMRPALREGGQRRAEVAAATAASAADTAGGRDDDSRVRAVTEAWLDGWVISLNLCPWAKLTKGNSMTGEPHTEICVLRGGEECLGAHASAVLLAADALRQRTDSAAPNAFSTTLLVFPDAAYLGHGPPDASCGAFPVAHLAPRASRAHRCLPAMCIRTLTTRFGTAAQPLVRQVQALLGQEANLLPVHLLAFHRCRCVCVCVCLSVCVCESVSVYERERESVCVCVCMCVCVSGGESIKAQALARMQRMQPTFPSDLRT